MAQSCLMRSPAQRNGSIVISKTRAIPSVIAITVNTNSGEKSARPATGGSPLPMAVRTQGTARIFPESLQSIQQSCGGMQQHTSGNYHL